MGIPELIPDAQGDMEIAVTYIGLVIMVMATIFCIRAGISDILEYWRPRERD